MFSEKLTELFGPKKGRLKNPKYAVVGVYEQRERRPRKVLDKNDPAYGLRMSRPLTFFKRTETGPLAHEYRVEKVGARTITVITPIPSSKYSPRRDTPKRLRKKAA